MTDRELDEILEQAANAPHPVEPALLERIAGSLRSSLRPVRTLPPAWMLAGALVLICGVVAIAGAARAGFFGIEKMGLVERAVIFAVMTILVCAAAAEFVGEMIPGSRRLLTPGGLLLVTSTVLLSVFAVLFRDYRTAHFVSAGLVCLLTGVLHAVPAGLAGWFVLRRGFAVNSLAAGLAGGILGGLAGVTMLELHCDNFQALHVILWHTAVVPASAALGALLAWRLRLRTTTKP